MKNQTIQTAKFTPGDTEIPLYIGSSCPEDFARYITSFGVDRLAIVTDNTVIRNLPRLLDALQRLIPTVLLTGEPGESMKTMEILDAHLNTAIEGGLTKQSAIVSFGGGVPGNLAGMLAALLYRGLPLFHVPTNLAAATDSVLSLKQAVNSNWGKNQIGTYYAPTAILVDVDCFFTQGEREIRAGMCEALKNALAIDAEQLTYISKSGLPSEAVEFRSMLDGCIKAKSKVMLNDPNEQKEALALEYGHTVGHGIEHCLRREGRGQSLTHGECVAIGMVSAAMISSKLGYLSVADVRLHEKLISQIGAPTRLPSGILPDTVLKYVLKDNKRGIIDVDPNDIPMVLLRDIGVPVFTDDVPLVGVPLDLVRETLLEISA
ncbi:hypothetical protein KTJ89_06735 [Brevibacterium sediminis]|uniref:2-deoxy-scyllo-inosose synthase n=1 Tax=Brevibacterium sediminis TaxID=1857024 RepID=UPI002174FF2C|nr:2-deoxy-scyllo-inosose synthase [Brevibacterium sediminis]MCS4592679.1 hypothetical protein [Brevibacterium sediminis]